MKLHVGTSGYAYKEWKGSFYPKDLPAKQMLKFYAERFSAVEINGSFYRLPAASAVEEWAAQVPPQFTFVLKAPQTITHFKRLNGAEEPLTSFLEVSRVLKDRRGPLFFQLPPNMKKDVPRLKAFLKLLKKERCTFEFRHASWFDDEIFDLLRESKVALCIAETDDDLKVPHIATADFGYLRLRRTKYTPADLKKWLKYIQGQDWNEAFVFFMHEDTGTGPKFAAKFLEIAAK